MDKNQIKHLIAARVAKELHNGDVVNLGIGLPTLIPQYLPEDVHVTLHSENGIIGTGLLTEENMDAVYMVDAGGRPAIAGVDGCYIDSTTSFALVRGGHVDVTVLGALEVDEKGNLANWIITGDKVPGMGGAMDLVVSAKKVIAAMEHTAKGAHKILNRCRLPFTAVDCVDLIVTEMGVMEVADEGIILKEYNPEFTIEQIQAATEATLIIDPDLKAMV